MFYEGLPAWQEPAIRYNIPWETLLTTHIKSLSKKKLRSYPPFQSTASASARNCRPRSWIFTSRIL